MHRWAEALLKRPIAILAWAVALLVGGSWAATEVPLEWAPKLELPIVRVSATWFGASPRAVERYVTAPIERAAQAVEGTASVESLSQEGRTTVTLEVEEGTELGPYVARLGEQLALVRRDLPDRVTPRLIKEIPEELRDEQGFMTLQLVGPQPPGMLRRWAEEQLKPKLSSLPGVADVVARGGTERELLVTLDPDRLASYGLSVGAIRGHLAQAVSDDVYGRLRSRGHAALLLSPAEGEIDALRRLVVNPEQVQDGGTPVRLSDIARVQMGPAPRRSISRIDGQPVVTLTLDRAPASHMLEVAASVEERLDGLRPTLPEGARLLVADDMSESVHEELRGLAWRGGLGLVLVAFVLLMMLKSVRAVAVVLFSVAVALAVAIALMGPLGLTLNLITLAGLVLVFGLLVDNSVVMVEQLILQRARRAARGRSGLDLEVAATRSALRAVWLPLVGGTVTTMAVMVPLVYLSGELRALFLPFGVLTALTLAASLVTAAALVPVLGRFLPPPEPERRLPHWIRTTIQMPFRGAARFPKVTCAVLLLVLGTPLWLVPNRLEVPEEGEQAPRARLAALYNATLGSDVAQDARTWLDPALGGLVRPFVQRTTFGEQWDFETQPEAYVSLGFPPGNPITRADSLLQRFEQVALASESVRRTIARIDERQATLRVQFYEPALQTAEPYLVRERLIQEAVLLAGIQVSVSGLLPQGYFSRSGGGISGFRVQAYGPNYDDLEALTERFAERLRRGSRRVAEVNTNAGRFGSQMPREELRIDWTDAAVARTGLSAQHIASEFSPMLAAPRPVGEVDLEGETRLPMRVVVEGAETTDIATLMDRPLPVTDASQVKLKSVTDYRVEEVPSRIERADQQYRRHIRVDYRGPGRMGSEYVDGVLETFQTPPGYRLERDQTAFFTAETQRAFGWVLLGTIALVFLVTTAIFESWRLPAVVLLSLPTAAMGVALGFLWADIAFAEGAFIGVVLLTGIAANDSILLADRYRQLRQARPHGRRSVLARLAVRERLRPMWTTTISTCVAMLPLLVFPQESDFWIGLAVTVTGGLLAATLLAPVATVALLTWWEDDATAEEDL